MNDEQKKLIKDVAAEFALAAHQSKGKEISGLFMEIKDELRELNKKLEDLDRRIIELDKRAVNWDNTNRIVFGLVSLVMVSVIGALITLVVRS